MSKEDYRTEILRALQARNRACSQFERIFERYDALTESINILASKSSRQKQRSRAVTENEASAETERLNNELAELYKKQASNAQQLIDTSNKLAFVQKELEKITLEHGEHESEGMLQC
uniref:Uncharacterized protein n=1 Tax=Acrobeloides nanus TaxID=290746 RepID=A0A914D0B1_9BILA